MTTMVLGAAPRGILPNRLILAVLLLGIALSLDQCPYGTATPMKDNSSGAGNGGGRDMVIHTEP